MNQIIKPFLYFVTVALIFVLAFVIFQNNKAMMNEQDARAMVKERYSGEIKDFRTTANNQYFKIIVEDKKKRFQFKIDRYNEKISNLKTLRQFDTIADAQVKKEEEKRKKEKGQRLIAEKKKAKEKQVKQEDTKNNKQQVVDNESVRKSYTPQSSSTTNNANYSSESTNGMDAPSNSLNNNVYQQPIQKPAPAVQPPKQSNVQIQQNPYYYYSDDDEDWEEDDDDGDD
ncbi:hypothetical protein ACMGE9_05080 [Macrococcus sp. EM39E]|uniref:hypothetical protein n=1 Tax=Macrococcus animalis TaxID=3395467 RepID=UPI0039BDF4A1